jgi:pyruvate-formate lyase-activating enzyme
MQNDSPSLIFSDAKGNIMDFEPLAMAGRTWDYIEPVESDDLIPIPEGSQLYVLPDRHPNGFDRETGELVVLYENPFEPGTPAFAVSVFLPAAYSQTFIGAWRKDRRACVLPLFPYTAVGWQGENFVVAGVRVDESRRQDPGMFDQNKILDGISAWSKDLPGNRLVKHLSNCALCYACPAALNLFQGREEAPLPTSPACNAACIGCISLQEKCGPPSPQQRINFIPSPEEIAEVALHHIHSAYEPVVSFGQGCEGEPLLVADTIKKAIVLIRKSTLKGTINLNSNSSLPERVAELADAGLDSLRISMNSPKEATYIKYFRPRYPFEALKQSALEMKKRDKFVSLNLFVFPGLTDAPREVKALKRFINDTGIDMIQWRNLNMDPDAYIEALDLKLEPGIGIRNLIESLPLRRGYFNPHIPK